MLDEQEFTCGDADCIAKAEEVRRLRAEQEAQSDADSMRAEAEFLAEGRP